jgi:hypothetical protein
MAFLTNFWKRQLWTPPLKIFGPQTNRVKKLLNFSCFLIEFLFEISGLGWFFRGIFAIFYHNFLIFLDRLKRLTGFLGFWVIGIISSVWIDWFDFLERSVCKLKSEIFLVWEIMANYGRFILDWLSSIKKWNPLPENSLHFPLFKQLATPLILQL